MTIHDIAVTAIDGRATTLGEYRGRVLLVVNVASWCAFTGQYATLEALYRRHKDHGLTVLGFPCGQFFQEPGGEAKIGAFCTQKYDVTFPMFAKTRVNGAGAHPLFKHLKAAKPGVLGTTAIKWNFTKFLVDRAGEVVGRYGPATGVGKIEKAVAELLAAPVP